mmetsp:Transcript_16294/g.22764  ORF Transcript_16294/g.22764 Transcript_16294/m.22764 type:complete len:212 (-) Transcript_16294:105-740(-)
MSSSSHHHPAINHGGAAVGGLGGGRNTGAHRNFDSKKQQQDPYGSKASSKATASHSQPQPFQNVPPQIAYGWFCPHPPPYGPYFWPCIPAGYTLVPTTQKSIVKNAMSSSNISSTQSNTAEFTKPVSTLQPRTAPNTVSIESVSQNQEAIGTPIAVPATNIAYFPSMASRTAMSVKRNKPATEVSRRNVKRKVDKNPPIAAARTLGSVPQS